MPKKKFTLGKEVNLMDVYPKSNRPVDERWKTVTVADRIAARKFEKEYFDGTRNQGFGGYNYNEKYWLPVAKRLKNYYKLKPDAKILVVGASKGFLMHDLKQVLPKALVLGIDISKYALENALPDVKPFMTRANAKEIPYADGMFDLVVSINTIHNLPLEDCLTSLKEIERVGKKNKFIYVDAWRTEEERQNMAKWVLTGLTVMSTDQWKQLFKLAGYTGDYYWFVA